MFYMQVQNGAVFCYIAAAFGDLDITNVSLSYMTDCMTHDECIEKEENLRPFITPLQS